MSVSQPAGANVAFKQMNFEHPDGPEYARPRGRGQNPAVKKEIESLDPVKDCQRIAYLMVAYEFPQEINHALSMAYFGSGATKAVADILGRSDFRADPVKRFEDTKFLIWKFMESGWDNDQGLRAIQHMNKIHGHYKIRNENFRMALCAFITAPIQWIENFGWRKLTDNERQGWFNFWVRIGELMEIEDIVKSPEESAELLESYYTGDEELSEYSPEIGETQFQAFVQFAPWYKKPFERYRIRALMTPGLARAYDLKYIPLVGKLPVVFYYKLNALARRYFSKFAYPYNIDADRGLLTYPQGTPVVEDAGPTYIVNRIKKKAAEATAAQ